MSDIIRTIQREIQSATNISFSSARRAHISTGRLAEDGTPRSLGIRRAIDVGGIVRPKFGFGVIETRLARAQRQRVDLSD